MQGGIMAYKRKSRQIEFAKKNLEKAIQRSYSDLCVAIVKRAIKESDYRFLYSDWGDVIITLANLQGIEDRLLIKGDVII